MRAEPLTFTLAAAPPFSLEPLRKLACGFLRGSRFCNANEVTVAFPLDGSFDVVSVTLRFDGSTVHASATGTTALDVVRRQVARFLALDHDIDGWRRVLDRDPVLARISSATPGGFRPVVAYSPYVMAGWSVLSQRIRMTQAAALQVRIAEQAGDVVGDAVASFPRPQSLLALRSFPGLSDEKLERLKAVATAALEGRLEVARLTAMPFTKAREDLMQIRGVGPWTADAILMRGCGPLDVLPLSERALHGAVAVAYGLKGVPSDAQVESIARAWAPFRMWASVMVIAHDFEAARARVGMPARSIRRAS